MTTEKKLLDQYREELIGKSFRTIKDGKAHYYDMHSGEEIHLDQLKMVNVETKKDIANKYTFNDAVAMDIIELVRRGYTLSKIADLEDRPPLEVIRFWRSAHPFFKKHLDLAKQDAAEGYADKIHQMAEEMAEGATKDEVNSKNAAINAYKWLAEKNDPDRYAKKSETKHVGDMAPAVININTGITRTTDKTLADIIIAPNKIDSREEQ